MTLLLIVYIHRAFVAGKHKKTSKEQEDRVTLVHYRQSECENQWYRLISFLSIGGSYV